MFQIQEIVKKEVWEEFLSKKEIEFFPFFQSWSWGEVQEKLGFHIVRRGVWKGKDLIAIYQIIDVFAKRGHFLHLRHGPVLAPFNQEVFDLVLSDVKNIAKGKGVSFIRISPTVPRRLVDYKMLKSKGFINAPIHNMDAEVCWVLDITKSEEEILKNMRKSHRYLIKKGIGNNQIKITKTKNIKDIDSFLPLYKGLSARKNFVPHRGVKEEFDIFGKEEQELLFLAEFEGKIIAGALIAFVGNTAIYRHSASDDSFRNIPAMYLILWEGIKEAKKRNKVNFNFWGIAPESSRNHPWQGLTLFKTGFGGSTLEFFHAQDLPLSPIYWKTHLIERASRIIKGY